ncbi:MAG: hypothetical protein JW795_19795 [Chitinivibrionales bacterium]|nr:hypothetical protein [Chitinivibrionales bacterium]
MKQKTTFLCQLSALLAMIGCIDPLDHSTTITQPTLYFSYKQKPENLLWAAQDTIPFEISIKNSLQAKELIIDFGAGEKTMKIPVNVSSQKDTVLPIAYSFVTPGPKALHCYLTLKNSSKLPADTLAIELGLRVVIKNDKKIQYKELPQNGKSFSCWVEIEGSEPVTCQWYFNNKPLQAKTNNVLTIPSLAQESQGDYRVAVRNAYGRDSSQIYHLKLQTEDLKPVIVEQPQSVTTTVGGSARFSIRARGDGLAFQWQIRGDDLKNATDSLLAYGPVQPSDSGASLRCIVSNAHGVAISKDVQLLVVKNEEKPVIVRQPADQQVFTGQKAVFTIEAKGTDLTFKWLKNGTEIAGATHDFVQLEKTTKDDSGAVFICVVENKLGRVVSQSAMLHVISSDTPITILKEPEDLSVSEGQPARFAVIASGTGILYQWLRNGSEIAGAVEAAYQIAAVEKKDNDARLRCRLRAGGGTIMSREARLIVTSTDAKKPIITMEPQSRTVALGDSVSFEIRATGEQLAYRWQANAKDITAAAAPRFSIAVVGREHLGCTYRCIVSNANGFDTSADASLTEVESAPKIVQGPENSILEPSKPCSLKVSASGGNLEYAWYKDDKLIKSSKDSVYCIASPARGDIGSYYVKVSNNKGTATSDPLFCVLLKWRKSSVGVLATGCRFKSLSSDNTLCAAVFKKAYFYNISTASVWNYDADYLGMSVYDRFSFINNTVFIPVHDVNKSDTLKLYRSNGEPLATNSTLKSSLSDKNCVLSTGSIIYACPYKIFSFNGKTAAIEWEQAISGIVLDCAADKSDRIGILYNENSKTSLLFVNEKGQMVKNIDLLSIPVIVSSYGKGILFGENGTVYVRIGCSTSENNSNVFLQKLNSDGNVVWDKTLSSGYDGIFLAPRGRLIVTSFNGLIALDVNNGSQVWNLANFGFQENDFYGAANDGNLYGLGVDSFIRVVSQDGINRGLITLQPLDVSSGLTDFCFSRDGDIIMWNRNNLYCVQTLATGIAQTPWPVRGADLYGSYRSLQ